MNHLSKKSQFDSVKKKSMSFIECIHNCQLLTFFAVLAVELTHYALPLIDGGGAIQL